MRYFFDTEFNAEVSPVELVSIGIVAGDNSYREFYGIHSKYTIDNTAGWGTASNWLNNNVKTVLELPSLEPAKAVLGLNKTISVIGDSEAIKNEILNFIAGDKNPEFWAYYGAYDWFLLCGLFGGFLALPEKWPQTYFDINQYKRHVGASLPEKFTPQHNALVDARWTKYAFESITAYTKKSWRGVTWPL